MKTVFLEPFFHKNQYQVGIRFEKDNILQNIAKKIYQAKWSQSRKYWYVPLNRDSYNRICKAFNGKAELDIAVLKQYLEKRKKVEATKVPKQLSSQIDSRVVPVPGRSTARPSAAFNISSKNLDALKLTVQHLLLKAYSASTIRTYRGELLVYFQQLGNRSAQTLTTDDIKRYLQKCLQEGLSENTIHSRTNALKYYYEQVLGRQKFFFEIPRPKKHLQLPKVLGELELTRLFNAISNKKHKAILFMAYSAGLRVSEVVNIKLRDVDSDRMQLFVEKSKRKKDRYVTLSPILLDVLRNYIKLCKPRPKVYLFEGQGDPGTQYSARSAKSISACTCKGRYKKRGEFPLSAAFFCHTYP